MFESYTSDAADLAANHVNIRPYSELPINLSKLANSEGQKACILIVLEIKATNIEEPLTLETYYNRVITHIIRNFPAAKGYVMGFGDYALSIPTNSTANLGFVRQTLERLMNDLQTESDHNIEAIFRTAYLAVTLRAPADLESSILLTRQLTYCLQLLSENKLLSSFVFCEKEYLEAQDKNQRFEHLRHIINNEAIHLVYQPIIDIHSSVPLYYEVLTRINHPTYTNTEQFFTDVNLYSLDNDIDRVIFRKLRDNLESGAIPMAHLAVNISAYTILDENIVYIADTLHQHGYTLYLELVERSYHDPKKAGERTQFAVDHHAVLVADDYGTAFANFEMLYHYDFGVIKIPRAYVTDVGLDVQKQRFVKSIVDYCSKSQIKCVAEGVETEAEKMTLIDMGIHYMQGYLFARPGSKLRDNN